MAGIVLGAGRGRNDGEARAASAERTEHVRASGAVASGERPTARRERPIAGCQLAVASGVGRHAGAAPATAEALGPRQQQRQATVERRAGQGGGRATLRQTDQPDRIQTHLPPSCGACGRSCRRTRSRESRSVQCQIISAVDPRILPATRGRAFSHCSAPAGSNPTSRILEWKAGKGLTHRPTPKLFPDHSGCQTLWRQSDSRRNGRIWPRLCESVHPALDGLLAKVESQQSD